MAVMAEEKHATKHVRNVVDHVILESDVVRERTMDEKKE